MAKRQTKNVKQNQRNRFDQPTTTAHSFAICRLLSIKTWPNEGSKTAFNNSKGRLIDMKEPFKRVEMTALSRH